jgi:trehalose 6-phosphate phosphatase
MAADKATNPAPGRLIGSGTALFLDFDGTLTGLRDDPASVRLPEGGEALLTALATKLGGAVAVVSGRDGRDLTSRTPKTLFKAGNHGDMLFAPGEDDPGEVQSAPEPLLGAARSFVGEHQGARLEEKARVLAIHTRLADIGTDAVVDALRSVVEAEGGYVIQTGKDIVELKPEGVHKGAAITRLMNRPPFEGRTPLFFGDDTTDEDGFAVCLERGGSAVKVGDGATMAPHRLSGPEAVWSYLRKAFDDLT